MNDSFLPSLPRLAAHLLGTVDYDACAALQQRLVYEASGSDDGALTLLLAEHPSLVTIGRQGSRADIRLSDGALATRQVRLQWASRGGGAIYHGPGQLAIYLVTPLAWHGLLVGEYLDRLQEALAAALGELGYPTRRDSAARGLWGRSGQLVSIAAAVRYGVSYFGAYLNVAPPMQTMRNVLSDLSHAAPLSSLAAERAHPPRMTGVRESLIRHLAAAFAGGRYHIHSSHPWLDSRVLARKSSARAG